MSKLKCNHCGHLNPVKSEFMTFCDHCGKKLSNNFQEWKKFNAGKSFNQYKLEIGSEEESSIQPDKNKPKGKISFALIIGLILAAFLLVEGYYLGYTGKKEFNRVIEQRAEMLNINDSPNWRLMEDKTGNFKIRFPGTAQKDVQTQDTEGETLYIVSYTLEADPRELGNHLYGITFVKYPEDAVHHALMLPGELDDFFKTVISSTSQTIGGEIKSIAEKTFKEYPGRKAYVSLQNGTIEMELWSILVQSRLYLLQVISPVETAGNKSIEIFFNSFEILEN